MEWLDSLVLADGGWDSREGHEEAMSVKAMTQRSCGYLFAENDEAVLVASSVDNAGGRAAGVVAIPRCVIISIKDLRR